MYKPGILYACHACDALQRVEDLADGEVARCSCCGNRLFRNPRGGIDRPLALAMASLILYLIANFYPVMTITIAGNEQAATLTDSARVFLQRGDPGLAAAVWLPTVFIPGFVLTGLLYVLAPAHAGWPLPGSRWVLAWTGRLLPWGMLDVFLLGVLVALVKLVALADVLLGTGFWAMLALIFTYAATLASFEPHIVWERLAPAGSTARG